jgi:hypothetical protein
MHHHVVVQNRAFGGKDEDITLLPKPVVLALAFISESLTWLSCVSLPSLLISITSRFADGAAP